MSNGIKKDSPCLEFRDKTGRLRPPWHAFPGYTPTEMGWRMGAGENYMGHWHAEFRALAPEEQKGYRNQYPAPLYWFWFYIIQQAGPTLSVFVLLLALITWPVRFFFHLAFRIRANQ